MPDIKINQCTITLTRQCNLRCNFCYAKKTKYKKDDTIKYEDLQKIVDFCSDAKVKYFVFTGGEPTLYPRLLDILKYIQKHKIIPAITTNGILLKDNSYCKLLIENGIEYFDISLKGKDSIECYETVGQDCYAQQLAAIRNLSSLDVEFTCSMVLTEKNIDSFCDMVRGAHNNGAKQFSFTFIIDNEESLDKDEAYLRNHNPFSLIESFLSHIDELNSITENWWIEYSFPICVYTDSQIEVLKRKFALPCQIHVENGITFDTQMNLIPCNMFFENRMGKLGVDYSSYQEFKRFSQKSLYRLTIDRLQKFPSSECNLCKYIKSCYGGCPVTWKNYSFKALREFKNNYYN